MSFGEFSTSFNPAGLSPSACISPTGGVVAGGQLTAISQTGGSSSFAFTPSAGHGGGGGQGGSSLTSPASHYPYWMERQL